MGVIYGANLTKILPTLFTPLTAYVFLIFVLLYPPCISALGTMKKEYGTKMMLFSITFQTCIAWIVAFIVYNVGILIWLYIRLKVIAVALKVSVTVFLV